MEIVPAILGWIKNHPDLAYVAVFLLALGESVPIVGGFVPGSTAIVGVGTLAATGALNVPAVVIVAASGAMIGDGLSFLVGRYQGSAIRKLWPFRDHPEAVTTCEKFFHKYGGMSVFFARFVPPVRALLPLMAGVLGITPRNFFAANWLAGVAWALLHVLSGVALDESFILVRALTHHAFLVAAFVAGFFVLILVARYFRYRNEMAVRTNKKSSRERRPVT